MRFFIFLCYLSLCCSWNSVYAAKVDKPNEAIALLASSQNRTTSALNRNIVTIYGFKAQEIRKYLMVSLGPRYTDLRYNTGTSFNGLILNDGCYVDNKPRGFTARNYEQTLADYEEKTKLINRCVFMRVTDLSNRGLRLPRRQANCEVERIDANTVDVSSGFCFFGLNLDSYFNVEYRLRAECANPDFAAWSDLPYADISNFSGFYIAGDATGYSLDLTPIDGIDVQTTFEPPPGVVPLTADLGVNLPRYPAQAAVDFHMAQPRMIASGSNSAIGSTIETQLLVNNLCEDQCRNGICVNICDYRLPIGIEFRLFQTLPDGREAFLDIWYGAGVAPASWQGFMPFSHTLPAQLLNEGESYRIQASLQYLSTYYKLAVDGFQQFLIDTSKFSDLSNAGAGVLPALDPLKDLQGLKGEVPTLKPLPGLLGGKNAFTTGFIRPLATLNSFIHLPKWPPYLKQVCDAQIRNCRDALTGDAQIEFDLRFTVSQKQAWQEIELTNVEASRRSNLLADQSTDFDAMPKISCDFVPIF